MKIIRIVSQILQLKTQDLYNNNVMLICTCIIIPLLCYRKVKFGEKIHLDQMTKFGQENFAIFKKFYILGR